MLNNVTLVGRLVRDAELRYAKVVLLYHHPCSRSQIQS